jgi:enoyl-[acyl-carrier protein] reductase II
LKELPQCDWLKQILQDLQHLYEKCPTKEELTTFLGRARAKRGMFEGI